MKVTNVLCPVDFSSSSDAALFFASSLAKEHGAELHIVHVYEEPFAYTDLSAYVPPADMGPAKDRLERTLPTSEVPFRHRFIVGNPGDKLVDYAKQNDVDLIVLGTHGRTGLNRMLMGSVAEEVVRRATCPVLTIRHPRKKERENLRNNAVSAATN